ncbi:MAG: hypothetical protein ACKODN_03535 [Actinomycetota bacterium]
MVDPVAVRAGVGVEGLVVAPVEDALVTVAMTVVDRVVRGAVMVKVRRGVSGSRVVRVVMIAVVSGVVRVVMTGVVRVGSGSRVVRVVMIAVVTGVVRVGSGSRVVKVGMNVVARVVMTGAVRVGSGSRVVRAVTIGVVRVGMTAVRDSVMIAMMPSSLRRSSVARRCSRVRARASTAKTNRLLTAKIEMSASSTRARFVASVFQVTNPSVRSAGRGGIEVACRSQHRPL